MTALKKSEGGEAPPAAESACVADMKRAKEDANIFAWANFTSCIDKIDSFDDVRRICSYKL